MTDTKQPDDSFFIALTIACLFGFGVLIAGTKHWTHGIVMVNDNYVHYDYHNYRGDLSYSIGDDPTQPRVQLCRVYPYEYARCVRTRKESSLAPLSDFDTLVLEKLYEGGLFHRKNKSITYTQKMEAP